MTPEMRKALKENISKMIDKKLENTITINFNSYEEVLSELNSDFLDKIRNEEISHAYIGSLLSRIGAEKNLQYGNLSLWSNCSIKDIVKADKEKNILTITFKHNRVAHYDFNTCEFIEKWAKEINFAIYCCKESEWVYNYPELFKCVWDMFYFGSDVADESLSCPKGLIPWLKAENKFLTYRNYYQYLFKDFKGKFSEYVINDNNNINFYFKNYKTIDKLISNENILEVLYRNFYHDAVELLTEMNDKNYEYDLNRGISYNKKQFDEWKNRHKNKLLAIKLQKLNFLNGLEIGPYVVKIPQSIDDLQSEGRNQNNCVGHFYNNSIINGKNLIYFLRKKDNVDNSYITARYNLDYHDTVEYRKKNNNTVNDRLDIKVIKEISEMITNYLQKRGE